MANKLYKHFTRIFVISETAKTIFDTMFPLLNDKTAVFHNVISPPTIKMLAEKGESFDDQYADKRILTVGWISKEKGCEEALEALSLLLERGF